MLGTPKELVIDARAIVLVGRLGLYASFPRNARHVALGEERFAIGVLARGEREKFLDEHVVLDGLVGLECRIQS